VPGLNFCNAKKLFLRWKDLTATPAVPRHLLPRGAGIARNMFVLFMNPFIQ
jgi:hypothetical protein